MAVETSSFVMKVIVVLDLLQGLAVHARRGERHRYQPIRSQFGRGEEPIALAQRMRDALGLDDFYVADLDAIQGGPWQADLLQALAAVGLNLTVDVGIRTSADLRRALQLPAHRVVVGLETAPPPEELRSAWPSTDTRRLIFGLDLFAGRPVPNRFSHWAEPLEVASEAAELGFHAILVLDLASVGAAQGPSTLPLCRAINQRFPEVCLLAGGGVRHLEDLQVLEEAGVDEALVATAFHQGTITAEEIQRLVRFPPTQQST
jgi:phosphoribosylformimino-5-aminoimidazole carboxamide ribotide isomerase